MTNTEENETAVTAPETEPSNDTDAREAIARKYRISAIANYSLYAILIGLFLFWNITRETGFKPGVFLFQTLPLLAFLPGMIKGHYRVYSWLCFIMLFYFIFAVQAVFTSTRSDSDFIFVGLTVLLFITSMTTSRWLQRLQKGFY